jgi:hypothetical protein
MFTSLGHGCVVIPPTRFCPTYTNTILAIALLLPGAECAFWEVFFAIWVGLCHHVAVTTGGFLFPCAGKNDIHSDIA